MLRKLEQNILPDPRRQVYAIIDDFDGIIATDRQMARPRVELQAKFEWFEAAHALAFQRKTHPALDQETVLKLLNLQGVSERSCQFNDFVPRINIQFSDRELTFKRKVVSVLGPALTWLPRHSAHAPAQTR
jgi:hypothetical protein